MKTVKISYNFKKNDDLAKDSYQPIIGGSVFLLAPEQFLTFSQFYNFYNTNDNNFPYIMFWRSSKSQAICEKCWTTDYGLEETKTLPFSKIFAEQLMEYFTYIFDNICAYQKK